MSNAHGTDSIADVAGGLTIEVRTSSARTQRFKHIGLAAAGCAISGFALSTDWNKAAMDLPVGLILANRTELMRFSCRNGVSDDCAMGLFRDLHCLPPGR